MFSNNTQFIIHEINKTCSKHTLQDNSGSEKEKAIASFLKNKYPKNKYLDIVFKLLQDLINDNLFFIDFPMLHIADFTAFILNNFGKKEKTDPRLLKFCRYLKQKSIIFPKITIKNPVAIALLT
jgi:hypothetical protein